MILAFMGGRARTAAHAIEWARSELFRRNAENRIGRLPSCETLNGLPERVRGLADRNACGDVLHQTDRNLSGLRALERCRKTRGDRVQIRSKRRLFPPGAVCEVVTQSKSIANVRLEQSITKLHGAHGGAVGSPLGYRVEYVPTAQSAVPWRSPCDDVVIKRRKRRSAPGLSVTY